MQRESSPSELNDPGLVCLFHMKFQLISKESNIDRDGDITNKEF